jgi:hypothetical protein
VEGQVLTADVLEVVLDLPTFVEFVEDSEEHEEGDADETVHDMQEGAVLSIVYVADHSEEFQESFDVHDGGLWKVQPGVDEH